MKPVQKIVGTKAEVKKGIAKHTVGGLTTKDIVKHKGRYVSKKKMMKARSNTALKNWLKAVAMARKELKVEGFMPIKKGTPLYNLAKKYYNEMKSGKKVSNKNSKNSSKKNSNGNSKKTKKAKRGKKARKPKSVVEMFKTMFSRK